MSRALTSRPTSVLALNCERGPGFAEVSPATRHKQETRERAWSSGREVPVFKGHGGLAPQNTTAKVPEVVEKQQCGTAEHREH